LRKAQHAFVRVQGKPFASRPNLVSSPFYILWLWKTGKEKRYIF
jgi:hypothetical protein